MQSIVRLHWAFAALAILGMSGCDAEPATQDAPPVTDAETASDSDRGPDISVTGSDVNVETEGGNASGVNIDVKPRDVDPDGPRIDIRIPDPNKTE